MCVEKRSDDLWLGVKRQTNLAIAGSPRNIFRYSLDHADTRGRDTERGWGARAYPLLPNSECVCTSDQESVLRGNLVVQEGNNPDHRIRSLIFA